MAFIPEVTEEQAAPDLRELYGQVRQSLGFLPRLIQAQGSRPDVIRANLELMRLIHQTGVIAPALKEQITLVVAVVNSSSYCIAAHLEMLHNLGVEKSLGRQLIRDFEAAPVPEREKALFRFAAKLTREPFSIKQPDIAELRRHGWDDAAILEVSLVAGYHNYVNRLAAALGVIPEHAF